MAVETKYSRIVRTGQLGDLLSPALPTLPSKQKPSDQIVKVLGGTMPINPMYLRDPNNSLAINSGADAVFNHEATRRKWKDTPILGDMAESGFPIFLNPILHTANALMLMKESTWDPIAGSIKLADQDPNDDFNRWNGFWTGVNTAVMNTLVNFGNTLDIASNPIKGAMIEGFSEDGEGFIKGFERGLTGDERGRKQYDYTDYGIPFLPAMGLEIISDPLTYVSWGTTGAAKIFGKPIAKTASKAVSEIAGELAERAVKEVVEETAEAAVKQAGKEIVEEVVENTAEAVAKEVAGEAAETVAKQVGKEVVEDTTETVVKEVAEEAVETTAEQTAKQTVKYTLDNGDDAVKYVVDAFKKRGYDMPEEAAKGFTKSISDGVANATYKEVGGNVTEAMVKQSIKEAAETAATEYTSAVKKLFKNLLNHMRSANADWTDEELVKYIIENIATMRKPSRLATDVSKSARDVVAALVPKTVDALGGLNKAAHITNVIDDAVTRGLRYAAASTSPIGLAALGGWEGAKLGFAKIANKVADAKFEKELINAKEFVELTDHKLDFTNGKVVEEAPLTKAVTELADTNVTQSTLQPINNSLDTTLKEFRLGLYDTPGVIDADALVKQQQEALDKVLKIIKERTGLNSFDDYIKAVKKLYDTDTPNYNVSQYIKKLELIKQYLTVGANDARAMSALFDALNNRPKVLAKYVKESYERGETVQEDLYKELQSVIARSNRIRKANEPLRLASPEQYKEQLKFAKELVALYERGYFDDVVKYAEQTKHFDIKPDDFVEQTTRVFTGTTSEAIGNELGDHIHNFYEAINKLIKAFDEDGDAIMGYRNEVVDVVEAYIELARNLNTMRSGLEKTFDEAQKLNMFERMMRKYPKHIVANYPNLPELAPNISKLIKKGFEDKADLVYINDDIVTDALFSLAKNNPKPAEVYNKLFKFFGGEESVNKYLKKSAAFAEEYSKLVDLFGDETSVDKYLIDRVSNAQLVGPIHPDFSKYLNAYMDPAEYLKTSHKLLSLAQSTKYIDTPPDVQLLSLLRQLPETPSEVYSSLESITSLVNHGVVAYDIMSSKLSVLEDAVSNNHALLQCVEDAKTEGTDLYKILNNPDLAEEPVVVNVRTMLERVDAFHKLNTELSESVQAFKIGDTNDEVKAMLLHAIRDNIVTYLERGNSFTANHIDRTLDDIIQNVYRQMDSRLDISASSMDATLNRLLPEFEKHGITLNLEDAHSAYADIDNWFKLALLDSTENPLHTAYKTHTKGMYKVIFDTETTSTALENAEIFQIAFKIVDKDDTVIKSFDHKILVSGDSFASPSFLNKIGEDAAWFKNNYVDNVDGTAYTLAAAFDDFTIKLENICGLDDIVWCGQNINKFDIPLLKKQLRRTSHYKLFNNVKTFDSLDVITLGKTWRLTPIEESALKKMLSDILNSDTYGVLTQSAYSQKVFSYTDLIHLRELNKLMYGTYDEVDSLKQITYDTLKKSSVTKRKRKPIKQRYENAWRFLQPSSKVKNVDFKFSRLTRVDLKAGTFTEEAEALYKELHSLYRALRKLVKDVPDVYNITSFNTALDSMSEMLKLVRDYKALFKTNNPDDFGTKILTSTHLYASKKFNKYFGEVSEFIDDLNNPNTYNGSLIETLGGMKQVFDVSETYVAAGTEQSTKRIVNSVVDTSELSSLEAAIKHANDAWTTASIKITTPEYIRMAPGLYDTETIAGLIKAGVINVDNSRNIMQRLQHHLASNQRVFLQPRKVMSYQLGDYFDVNKIIADTGDMQTVSFLKRLTKQAQKYSKVKAWFSLDVAKVLKSEIDLLWDVLKDTVPNYKYLYDDLSLIDKASIVKANLYTIASAQRIGTLADTDPLKQAYFKLKDLNGAYDAVREADQAFYKELYAEQDALYAKANLEYVNRIELGSNKAAPRVDYAYEEDAIYLKGAGGYGVAEQDLKVTKDNLLRCEQVRMDNEHHYNVRQAMVSEALDKPIAVVEAAKAYLAKCDDEAKIAFARGLKNSDALLTEAALKQLLDSPNRVESFIAHSKYSGGFKVFPSKTKVDLSDFEADTRCFVNHIKEVDAYGEVKHFYCIVVKKDTFLEAWEDTSVDSFYKAGARYIPVDGLDKTGNAIIRDIQSTKSAALQYVGYSTGDVLSEGTLQSIIDVFIPPNLQDDFVSVEFLKHLPNLDEAAKKRGIKFIDYFDTPRADNIIIGDYSTHQYFNPYYNVDPVNRVAKAVKTNITKYVDGATLAINYLCNKHNGLTTGDLWAMLSDEDVYNLLKSNRDDWVCVIVEPASKGLNKTESGVSIRRFQITSVADVKVARKYNAHVVPVDFMYDLSKIINEYKLPKWAQVFNSISAAFKVGYLASLGWPIRNFVDSSYKTHIDRVASNAPVNREFVNVCNGTTTIMRHHNLLSAINKALGKDKGNRTVVKTVSDYKILYHYLQDTPEQFKRYIGSLDDITKLDPTEAWSRKISYNHKASVRKFVEGLDKLDAHDKAKIKKQLLDPEMFALVHDFIQHGPSAGLTNKLQEQLYDGLGDKKFSQWLKKITNPIFDSNTLVEQGARFTTYLNHLRKGDTVNKAVRAVIETHFDYADKSLLMLYTEMLFPFMSFTFKNLTYWVERLMDVPYLSKELENILRPLLSYHTLWQPDQEVYEAFDYSFDFEEDILEVKPTMPWQKINAARLYHIMSGNLMWDTGKDVQHDAGYGEQTNDLYAVFKLSPSFLDAVKTLTNPIDQFQERLLPPYELLIDLASKALNEEDTSALNALSVDALLNALPYVGAVKSRLGVVVDEDNKVGLKHNNVWVRVKDAGVYQALNSLFTAAYVPHSKYNTWYGADGEYLTKLNNTYPKRGGFKFNYYSRRTYGNLYRPTTSQYQINRIARRIPNKDLYASSKKTNIKTSYSALFHSPLYDNVLKKRVLDKYALYK